MHTEQPYQTRKRENDFAHHAPTDGQPERYERIRGACNQLALLLNTNCPPSRELSLAMTKLEEVVFWANAAIARNEEN